MLEEKKRGRSNLTCPGFGELSDRCVENRWKNKGMDGSRDPMGHGGGLLKRGSGKTVRSQTALKMCVCLGVCGSILSFHHMDLRDQSQAVRLDSKRLDLLSHLAGLPDIC